TSAPIREAAFVVVALIAVNVVVFLYQIGLPAAAGEAFIYRYALLPARFAYPELAERVGLDPYNYLPFLTNTFMHAGWFHIIVNMWTLWLFGRPVEARLGAPRFLFFYLACGALASAAHFAFNLDSVVPALGASGAVAGVLGGYTLLFPRARVTVVVPIAFIPYVFHLPAVVYTLVWFALQVLQGTAALAEADAGGIAWWAHIGGFVGGLALVRLVGTPRRRTRVVGADRDRTMEIGDARDRVRKIGPQRARRPRAGLGKSRLPQVASRRGGATPGGNGASPIPGTGKRRRGPWG
ncbi:MAG: rhomboid family intramembrane serine protease, partial [Alphaproteobacteria bacterium]